MGTFKKYCKNPNCGKEFLGTRTQQYCCPSCRIPTYIPKKARYQPKRTCTLDEVARQAKESGMSYGKYVAMQYKKEKETKNKV